MPVCFTRFATAIGRCAIAWGAQGVTGVWLPRSGGDLPAASVWRRWPQAQEAAPPPAVAQAIAAIVELLAGRARPLLDDVPLDMAGQPDFARRVYAATRRIPPGQTRTYGELAQAVGEPGAARAVGQALGRNPFPIVVPCHRVLAAGGRAGGFSAPGGVASKHRLLEIEGGLPKASLFDAP